MNTASSVWVWSLLLLLKRYSRMGIYPKTGIRDLIRLSSCLISPPITMVSPSFTRTTVSASRVVIRGPASRRALTEETSGWMERVMYPSALMDGVTRKVVPTSIYFVVSVVPVVVCIFSL